MRNRFLQITGLTGAGLTLAGIALYAVNTNERTIAAGVLIAGLALLALYALFNHRVIIGFFLGVGRWVGWRRSGRLCGDTSLWSSPTVCR